MSSNIRVQRICQYCGNEFIAKTTVTKYCGDICAKKAYKKRQREGKIKHSAEEISQVKPRPIKEVQEKDFLSIQEACLLLGISRMTLYRMIKSEKNKSGPIRAQNDYIQKKY